MKEDLQVRWICQEEIAQHIRRMDCPVCQMPVTMIKVEEWPQEEEGKWRCMGCLHLFELKLTEVKEVENEEPR